MARARSPAARAARRASRAGCSSACAISPPSQASRVDAKIADAALTRLEVDARGLDAFDTRYLQLIAEAFGGGPVGIETIAAALGESRDAIEEIVEPFLMQQGFVQRTPRGRMLTGAAFAHIGLPAPPRSRLNRFCSTDDE